MADPTDPKPLPSLPFETRNAILRDVEVHGYESLGQLFSGRHPPTPTRSPYLSLDKIQTFTFIDAGIHFLLLPPPFELDRFRLFSALSIQRLSISLPSTCDEPVPDDIYMEGIFRPGSESEKEEDVLGGPTPPLFLLPFLDLAVTITSNPDTGLVTSNPMGGRFQKKEAVGIDCTSIAGVFLSKVSRISSVFKCTSGWTLEDGP
ncbi:hypothetical protein BDY24DRAFT_418274 [Mrakia frigida]|uniref:uncharacterized protein n=1 Tax=Mrakia frigida TaxID=29902 RepID=UPI003FCC1989